MKKVKPVVLQLVKQRLFGTDGIRGEANVFPMTPETVVKIGQAIGHILQNHELPWPTRDCKVVIGKDTRLSGYMIEQALSSGLCSMGVHVQLVGPLPTPGIGFITRNMRAAAGIVISASHNPYPDNGIKIFGHDGFKISDAMEREIERLVLSEDLVKLLPPSEKIGRSKRIDDAMGRYLVYTKSTFPLNRTLDGLRIVLDTAHGAAYKVAPKVFQELGAEVIHVGGNPNGTNINDEVGALHPAKVAEAVLFYRADLGISLDGDADRVILVDEKGKLVNGDHILGVCALHMKEKGILKNDTLVCTQMSNYGLEKKLSENGIRVVKTNVGDKFVVEEMRRGGFSLGGEQSGHIIFLDNSTTGDGIIAALAVLSIMVEKKQKLSEITAFVEDIPQVLINCRVREKKDLKLISGYKEMIESFEAELEGVGRIFVRYSGTEPLIRILVEGPDDRRIAEIATLIADLCASQLSSPVE